MGFCGVARRVVVGVDLEFRFTWGEADVCEVDVTWGCGCLCSV